MEQHKHRAVKRLDTVKGFTMPAIGAKRQDPRAHGATTLHQVCRCGARRMTNQNWNWREVGAWVGGTEA